MVVGSGSKDSSNGCADVSLVLMCFFSISSCLEGQMYPACDEAGCRALTHESWTMLCATFLLSFLHLKIWSQKQLCFCPHLQVGVLAGS